MVMLTAEVFLTVLFRHRCWQHCFEKKKEKKKKKIGKQKVNLHLRKSTVAVLCKFINFSSSFFFKSKNYNLRKKKEDTTEEFNDSEKIAKN